MAPPFIFALLGLLSASLALAGPVALDAATLLLNGQQALVLNCQFQSLQNGSSCTPGEFACLQQQLATCVNGTWQTSSCPSNKQCFALPSVRTNGTFIACTSPNNAASIIAATGIQTDIANNCTSLGDTPFPFPTVNNTTPGDGGNDTAPGVNYQPNCSDQGTSSLPGQVITSTPITTAQPTLTLPPTTTTLSPEQALSSISLLSVNGQNLPPSVPSVVNLGGNTNGAPSVILLTSRPTPSPSK
ncbi:hypothetical protein BC827DRAFT_1335530 [Russula dissimulans]|nr:hypothetical protein BC827DRAFT_1335530 [Russula dissimulans]